MGTAQSWQHAWEQALYGEQGFYRRPEGPAGHFSTSTLGVAGELLADALLRLAEDEALTTIVDIGCGRGELLTALAERAPAGTRLLGVDVVERPAGLEDGIEWLRSPGGTHLPDLGSPHRALVLAHEWLDVVPCLLARADEGGRLRELGVDEAGREHLTDLLSGEDAAWAERWWPGPYAPGDLVEVGRARDRAHADLLGRIGSGLLVVVDYGHLRTGRPVGGTLLGYRDGAPCPPVPDGSCDITAHVAMDSLQSEEVLTQRAALRRLGVDATRPSRDLARSDPAGYLTALSEASRAASLTGPGPGDFFWAFTRLPGPASAASSCRRSGPGGQAGR